MISRSIFVDIDLTSRIILFILLTWCVHLPAITKAFYLLELNIVFLMCELLANISIAVLTIYPLTKKVFLGVKVSWFHPLIFMAWLNLFFQIVKNPAVLFGPLIPSLQISYNHEVFEKFLESSLRISEFELLIYKLIAMLCLYMGFSAKQYTCKIAQKNQISVKYLKYLFLIMISFLIYNIYVHGGIVSFLLRAALGRYTARIEVGYLSIIVQVLPYLLFMILLHPKTRSNFVLIIYCFVGCCLTFIITGSRSETFVTFLVFIIGFAIKRGNFPFIKMLVLVLIVAPSSTILSDIRRGDISSLDDYKISYAEIREKSLTENNSRKEIRPNEAVINHVPELLDFRYGATYVPVLAFFIPRSVWVDKPRSGGADAAALIYYGKQTLKGYSGEGYPISGVVEAYWNFHLIGIILLFFIYGYILKLAAIIALNNNTNLVIQACYLLILMNLIDFNSDTMVTVIQLLILFILILLPQFILPKKLRRFV